MSTNLHQALILESVCTIKLSVYLRCYVLASLHHMVDLKPNCWMAETPPNFKFKRAHSRQPLLMRPAAKVRFCWLYTPVSDAIRVFSLLFLASFMFPSQYFLRSWLRSKQTRHIIYLAVSKRFSTHFSCFYLSL